MHPPSLTFRIRLPLNAPVLAYREVVQHPRLGHRIESIRAILEAAKNDEARKTEWQENAVPLPDDREDVHKASEVEVSCNLYAVNLI